MKYLLLSILLLTFVSCREYYNPTTTVIYAVECYSYGCGCLSQGKDKAGGLVKLNFNCDSSYFVGDTVIHNVKLNP